MPANPFALQLFNAVDPTSTALLEVLNNTRADSVRNLVHQTNMPAGFDILEFSAILTTNQLETWIEDRKFFHVKMTSGDTVLWDGRIEDIRFTTNGGGLFRVRIRAYGYYYNFSDTIDTRNHSSTRKTVITNLRDDMDADTLQLSTDDENIDDLDSGTTIAINKSSTYASALETIRGGGGLLSLGDGSGNPVNFAVWEDQKIYYSARSPSTIDWFATVQTDVREFSGESRGRDLFNAIDAQDSASTVGFDTDIASINKFLRRERVVGSTELNTAAATAERNAFLEDRKDGIINGDSLSINRVRDTNNAPRSLCEVRAGEVIRLSDFFASSNRLSVALNKRNTFVILQTRCHHRNGQEPAERLELILDSIEGTRMSSILASGGIRG